MAKAAGGGTEEVRRSLIERSAHDEALRRDLLADPRGTIERETGATLPEGVEIRAVEETPETVYLVLPPKAAVSESSDELSDRELESLAGGWSNDTSSSACDEARRRVQ